jgi:hypothetical protein
MSAGFKQCFPEVNAPGFPISLISTNYKIGLVKQFKNGIKLTTALNVSLFHKPINYSSYELGSSYYSGGEFSKNKANIELEFCPLLNLFSNFFFLKTGIYLGYNTFPDLEAETISRNNSQWPTPTPVTTIKTYNYTFKRGPEAGFIIGTLLAFKLGKRTKLTFDYDLRFGSIYIKNCTVNNNVSVESFSINSSLKYYTSNIGIWYQLK